MVEERTAHNRPPRRPLTAWVLLVPIVFFIGVWWQGHSQLEAPLYPLADVPRPMHHHRGEAPEPMVAPSTTPATPAGNASTIFVAGDDAYLHPKSINDPSIQSFILDPKAITRLVEIVIRENGKIYPPKTRPASPVRIDKQSNALEVNLNREFGNESFWKEDPMPNLAVYAIVNTLAQAASHKGSPLPDKIVIMIDGKPLDSLGQFDFKGPLEFNRDLVMTP